MQGWDFTDLPLHVYAVAISISPSPGAPFTVKGRIGCVLGMSQLAWFCFLS